MSYDFTKLVLTETKDKLIKKGKKLIVPIKFEPRPEPSTLPANTLLIEIKDSDEARSWVEENYTYEKVSNTQYKITNTSTDWESFFDNDIHAGSNEYLLKVLEAGDTSSVTSMSYMFYSCQALTNIVLFDTSNVENMCGMFADCTRLISIPAFNTNNVTAMDSMFANCTTLTSIPTLNTNKVTKVDNMFIGCSSLVSVPPLNTSKVTNTAYMFKDCISLINIPELDLSNVSEMYYMFSGCTSLISVQTLNTVKCTNMNNLFTDCDSLISVPEINVDNVSFVTEMFKNCVNINSGMTQLYNNLISTGKVTNYTDCFTNTGKNTATGLTERLQIPKSWGGDLEG